MEKRAAADLTDLANIANTVATIFHEAWESDLGELEYEQQAVRVFVEAVSRVAKLPLILNGLPFPQQVQLSLGCAMDALEQAGLPTSVPRRR